MPESSGSSSPSHSSSESSNPTDLAVVADIRVGGKVREVHDGAH
eukprot:CAMPEP_0171284978 /NCGR_PEP_ID=MMETSP0790-20130122/68218_1 /TAXON_ID=2925 /ORGANISM="Alexandrium catenella, Strain OF101" /LENGTH=43 /DNA_ID= /DNA_START= /DNA_END= /DNA_ORIENTATION=